MSRVRFISGSTSTLHWLWITYRKFNRNTTSLYHTLSITQATLLTAGGDSIWLILAAGVPVETQYLFWGANNLLLPRTKTSAAGQRLQDAGSAPTAPGTHPFWWLVHTRCVSYTVHVHLLSFESMKAGLTQLIVFCFFCFFGNVELKWDTSIDCVYTVELLEYFSRYFISILIVYSFNNFK